MGLLGTIAGNLTHVAANVNNAIGGDQDIQQKLNQASTAFKDPNLVLSNPGAILDRNVSAFTPAATPVAKAASGGNQTAQTQQSGSVTTGPYNGGTGTGTNNAADLAYIDDQTGQLRSFLDRTNSQLSNGLTQLDYDYNKQLGDANQQKAAQDAKYGTQIEDTTNAKDSAIERVNTGARTLANSVRNIIGRASGSGSSAFQLTAPKAVIDKATDDATDVNETFGKNFRDIDTAKKDAQMSYDNMVRDLGDEKKTKESSLREGVYNTQNDTEGQLADLARQKAALQGGSYSAIRAASAPLQQSINNRQATIDQLFQKFATPYTTAAATYTAPTLADYTSDPTKVAATVPTSAQTSQVLAPWLKQNQDDEQLY